MCNRNNVENEIRDDENCIINHSLDDLLRKTIKEVTELDCALKDFDEAIKEDKSSDILMTANEAYKASGNHQKNQESLKLVQSYIQNAIDEGKLCTYVPCDDLNDIDYVEIALRKQGYITSIALYVCESNRLYIDWHVE